MSRGITRAERLQEMERLYCQRAYSDIEMAERLSTPEHRVDRTTIYRDRGLLESEVPFSQDEDGRYRINRAKYLSSIRVDLREALSLYLAARRASQQTHSAQKHTASALEKLAVTLRKPMTERLVKAADAILQQKAQPERDKVFEVVADAWVQGLRLRVTYQGLHSPDPYQDVISPYLIEPSPWSDSVYVIGPSDRLGKIVPYKLDRIQRAALTSEPFALPEDFDEQELLRHAWGIWRGEGEPVAVKLKFAPGEAARRVQESVWHPLERVTRTEDGGCLWEAPIAEWREMVPWVRGWGADCEVVELEELREALTREALRLARLYQVVIEDQDPSIHRLLQCWGKTSKQSGEFHPALFHMLDVGHTARALLEAPASPRWRRVLGHALGCDNESLGQWLPFFIALHDIGKVSSVFQSARSEQQARLEGLGFAFGPRAAIHHSVIGQVFSNDVLASEGMTSLPSALWQTFNVCTGGHHGRFLVTDSLKEARSFLKHHEPKEWHELRLAAVEALRPALLTKAPAAWPEPENISTAIAALTGFTILCDWLGSDNNAFQPESSADLAEYVRISARRAQKAVSAAGFHVSSSSTAPIKFAELFVDKQPARPLQEAVDAIPAAVLGGPCLAIIEAPTGEGKTEAALALAHRLAQISGTDELYYALPTTATSNQMFGRLQEHLRDRLGLSAQIKLVHGQAFLVEDDLRLDPLGDEANDHAEAAQEWFGPKKRALLAPFGVGTVDQVELAVLNVKHTALRMIGLAGKVVIFDEVHAYDTYMTTIIEMLLKWLRALGSSVIILSATLPQARRLALARAYGVDVEHNAEAQTYPSLWVFGEGASHHAAPRAQQPARNLSLGFLHIGDERTDIAAKARWLLDSVAHGGCACWMTNTVKRGQDIFEAVDRLAEAENLTIDRMLFHAQYPLSERERREQELRDKYGPQGLRPKRGIVIGTQVLEQSLDLDFDVMVTDLAPMDLLLQRAGRLHRHERTRPVGHESPHLWVNVPQNDAGEIEIGVDRYIYASFLLRQTWAVLHGLSTIELPRDYRILVEAVYGFNVLPADHLLQAEWQELKEKEARALGEANIRLLPEPDPEWAFSSRMSRLQFEENDNSAAWIIARTRLGEESITVIPMERRENVAWAWPTGEELSLTRPVSRDTQLALLRKQLRISNQAVVHALKTDTPPALFIKSALLKECLPLWLTDGQLRIPLKKGVVVLTMDQQLGLKIRKEGV